MTSEEAIQRVRAIYAEAGKPLSDDIRVAAGLVSTGGWFSPKRKTWVVRTDASRRGGNHFYQFDAETGELMKEGILQR
jgi:hypothetical protein